MHRLSRVALATLIVLSAVTPLLAQDIAALGNAVNASLEASGADYRLEYVEMITSDDSGEAGQTVFFNNRGNKQLTSHFVAGDPRRVWSPGNTITYTIDQAEGAVDGLTVAQTSGAISAAMNTWSQVSCSTLTINQNANTGGDIGIVEFQNGLGGAPFVFADIQHTGWVPAGVFAPQVIAATFTFIWTSGGVPTDVDNDGRTDTAFREVLYHNNFLWAIGSAVDVETIALHESGHALSQGHFGTAFLTTGNNKLHFAPRAVMNAAYSGVQRQITATDNGGHCSIWASWPD